MTRTWVTIGLSTITIGLLSLAAVLVISPSVLPPNALIAIERFEAAISRRRFVASIAFIFGMFGLWSVYWLKNAATERDLSSATATEPADAADDDPFGDADLGPTDIDAEATVVGVELTTRVEQTVASLEHGRDADTEPVVDRLRDTLIEVETAHSRAESDVADRIRTGSWTDDQVAATFLAPEGASSVSVWRRIYAWIFPGRSFEKRCERTLAVLEDHESTLGDRPETASVEEAPHSVTPGSNSEPTQTNEAMPASGLTDREDSDA